MTGFFCDAYCDASSQRGGGEGGTPTPPITSVTGVMAGALWTADRAHRRGLRQDGNCPYCSKGTREDEDHLLWWCAAWKSAREPFLPELMLLAWALKLGALSDWPPCLRLCGLLPEEVCEAKWPGEGARLEEALQGAE